MTPGRWAAPGNLGLPIRENIAHDIRIRRMSILELDICTVLRLLIIGNLFTVVLLLAYHRSERPEFRYRLFLGGKIFQAVAWLLLSLRGHIACLLSLEIGNAILFAGFALEALAFALNDEQRERRLEQLFALLTLAGCLVFWLSGDNPGTLVGVASLIALVLFGTAATIMLRRPGMSSLYRAIALSYVAFCFSLALRVWFTLGQQKIASLFHPGAVQSLTFLILFSFMMVGSVGFVLLSKERTDDELRRAALHDHLTSILNRRAFIQNATLALHIAIRQQAPVSLLMLDIDHFKWINDTHGHAVGDVVLRVIAARVGQMLRTQDIFGRLGGEEFAVLMFGSGEAATEVAERLRFAIEQLESHDAPGVRCTASIGVCTCIPQSQEDLTRLLNNADAALYQAKVDGRNRVRRHGEVEGLPGTWQSSVAPLTLRSLAPHR